MQHGHEGGDGGKQKFDANEAHTRGKKKGQGQNNGRSLNRRQPRPTQRTRKRPRQPNEEQMSRDDRPACILFFRGLHAFFGKLTRMSKRGEKKKSDNIYKRLAVGSLSLAHTHVMYTHTLLIHAPSLWSEKGFSSSFALLRCPPQIGGTVSLTPTLFSHPQKRGDRRTSSFVARRVLRLRNRRTPGGFPLVCFPTRKDRHAEERRE